MLSTSAFNALLKTLEEPPAHAKFIFATTEIRKVPVTVLSRCQRFDLKRVAPDVMTAHLAHVAQAEGLAVSDDGLKLVARASEGSVRDALSLLDQALVQGGNGDDGPVSADAVRDMLGLADRSASFDVFAAAVAGDAAAALAELDRQYAAGADPVLVLRDMLDHCHGVTRAKALGAAAEFADAADHIARIRHLADATDMGHLSRVWQMLLKGHEETRAAPDPMAAAEMAVLRVVHAAGLPSPEEAARMLAQSHNQSQTGPGAGGSTAPSVPGGGQSHTPSHSSSHSTTQSGAPPGGNVEAGTVVATGTSGAFATSAISAEAATSEPATSLAPGQTTARRADPAPQLSVVEGGRTQRGEDDQAVGHTQPGKPQPGETAASPDAPPHDDAGYDYGVDADAGMDGPPAYHEEPGYGDGGYGDDGYSGPDMGDAPGVAGASGVVGAMNTAAPVVVQSLDDVSQLAQTKRDYLLKAQIDRGMRLARLEAGKLVFAPTDAAPEDLSARLSRALLDWTGQRWFVSCEPGSSTAETLSETRRREMAEREAAVLADPVMQQVMDSFPGAEIVAIRGPEDAGGDGSDDDDAG